MTKKSINKQINEKGDREGVMQRMGQKLQWKTTFMTVNFLMQNITETETGRMTKLGPHLPETQIKYDALSINVF